MHLPEIPRPAAVGARPVPSPFAFYVYPMQKCEIAYCAWPSLGVEEVPTETERHVLPPCLEGPPNNFLVQSACKPEATMTGVLASIARVDPCISAIQVSSRGRLGRAMGVVLSSFWAKLSMAATRLQA